MYNISTHGLWSRKDNSRTLIFYYNCEQKSIESKRLHMYYLSPFVQVSVFLEGEEYKFLEDNCYFTRKEKNVFFCQL